MCLGRSTSPTPRWHSIASLSLIARVIDGQLEAAEEQHRLLLQARPGSLDNAIVERVVRIYTEEVVSSLSSTSSWIAGAAVR
jgi:hypothetical protein